MTQCARAAVALLFVFAFVLPACGGDDDDEAAADTQAPQETVAQQNACPLDGCTIEITDVENEGTELRVTWTTNFEPDFSKNHIHIYWDTYTADEVSNDAAEKGKTQGEWVPTGDYPEFVTEGVVSTTKRSGSTTLCVTAADRDHNVLDSSITDCYDVAALL
jgi:hypothetical protein